MAQDDAAGSGMPHFSVGGAITAALSVVGRNFIAFTIITVLIGIPMIAMGIWAFATLPLANMRPGVQFDLPPGAGLGLVVLGVVLVLTYILTQSAINYGTFVDLRGQRASIGECLGRAFSALPRLILAGLLLILVLVGGMIGMSVLMTVVSLLSPILGIVVLIAFAVAGVIIYVMWWVFVPAIVVEGAGPVACFGRSRELTRGHRWGIFGLLVLVFVAQILVSLIVGQVVRLVGMVAGEILNIAVSLFFTALNAALSAVGYYYLRAEKEGFGIADLARVFD